MREVFAMLAHRETGDDAGVQNHSGGKNKKLDRPPPSHRSTDTRCPDIAWGARRARDAPCTFWTRRPRARASRARRWLRVRRTRGSTAAAVCVWGARETEKPRINAGHGTAMIEKMPETRACGQTQVEAIDFQSFRIILSTSLLECTIHRHGRARTHRQWTRRTRPARPETHR